MHKTGMPLLDDILGGGLPNGVCLIEGMPGSGVSSLAHCILRESALRTQQHVCLIDAAMDSTPSHLYAHTGPLGIYAVPRSAEAALDLPYQLLTRGIRTVALDHLDALLPTCDTAQLVGTGNPDALWRLVYHAVATTRKLFELHSGLLVLCAGVRRCIRTGVLRSFHSHVLRDCVGTYLRLRTCSSTSRYGKVVHREVAITRIDPASDRVLGEVRTRVFPSGFLRGYDLLLALKKRELVERRGSWLMGAEGARWPTVLSACQELESRYAYWEQFMEVTTQCQATKTHPGA